MMINKPIQTIVSKKDVPIIVQEINQDGFSLVEDVFNKIMCESFCKILDEVLCKIVQKKEYFGSSRTQVIYNYFIHDTRLCALFSNPLIDNVMKRLIGEDYVLISPSARNPRICPSLPEGKATSGEGWHIDSKVAFPETGGLYKPSMSFYAVVMLEPFRPGNSATKFIRKSHLRYQKPPNREADLPHETWTAPAGSLLFFDSALWHRTGVPTEISRWSIFNMYGPWFMKPYFDFRANISKEILTKLPESTQRLLHCMSVPPKDINGRRETITTKPVFD
jgi:hypothetical protein